MGIWNLDLRWDGAKRVVAEFEGEEDLAAAYPRRQHAGVRSAAQRRQLCNTQGTASHSGYFQREAVMQSEVTEEHSDETSGHGQWTPIMQNTKNQHF